MWTGGDDVDYQSPVAVKDTQDDNLRRPQICSHRLRQGPDRSRLPQFMQLYRGAPMNADTVPSPATEKVYYHKNRALFMVLGVMMLALSVFEFVALAVSRQPALIFPGVWMLLLSAWMLSMGRVLRIVVSPGGIAYHNSGFYTIQSPWTNVESIASVPFFRWGSIRCVRLRELAVSGWTGLAVGVSPDLRGRVIPLSGGWADRDDLEREIRRHAPQVNE